MDILAICKAKVDIVKAESIVHKRIYLQWKLDVSTVTFKAVFKLVLAKVRREYYIPFTIHISFTAKPCRH